jgi:hypothetical protein
MDIDFYDEIALPQIVLFTILIIIIIWLTTKKLLTTVIIGGIVFCLGYNGYLEDFGIGTRPVVRQCVNYLINNQK